MQYDVFISYSHAADDLLSERVQDGLQRFAKPWFRRRELSVFRDRTGLTADPGLWSSIVEAMAASRYFLLLASPEAGRSEWVNREIAHWRELHGGEHLLVLQTDGEIVWDNAGGDFDLARSTALPAGLAACFAEEPRHVDMRWARSEEQLDLTNGRFRDQIAELSAPIHGVRKDDIAGEHVRQHRRTVRTVVAAAIVLAFLTIASVAGAALAVRSADRARASERRAVTQQRRADSEAELARKRGKDLDDKNAELATTNVVLASTNTNLKTTNGKLVAQTAETDAQRRQADQNAAEANSNANRAQQNATRATLNAQEAARNADEAARNAKTARDNADTADANAARAEQNALLAAAKAREAADNAAEAIRNAKTAAHNAAVAKANEKKATDNAKIIQHRNVELAASNAAGLSRQLAAQSLLEIDHLDRALLLGVASWNASPTPAAHDALLRLAESSVGVEGFLRPPGVTPDSPALDVVALATTPDGRRRAEWVFGHDIAVWNGAPARTAKLAAQIPPGAGFTVTGMSFSPDGKHLVAWDVTQRLIRSWNIDEPSAPPREHAFSCDGFVSCNPVVTPRYGLVVPGISEVAFLDPATLLGPTRPGRLGADGDGPSARCAIPSWSGVRPLSPERTETCVSASGRFAFGRSLSGVPILWDLANGAATIALESGPATLQHPVVSDDEKVGAAVSPLGDVHVFDLPSGQEAATFSVPPATTVLAIAPDRSSLAAVDEAGNLTLRSLPAGGDLFDGTVEPSASSAPRLEYSRDGRWLAYADAGRVQVVQVAIPHQTASFRADGSFPIGIEFDWLDHALVRVGDNTLLVWNLATNSPVSASTGEFGEKIVVSPQTDAVAALSSDQGVSLFSLADLTMPTRTLPGSRSLSLTAFGPNHRLTGAEANGTLIEWNLDVTRVGRALASNRPASSSECELDPGNDCPLLAVSPDGTTIATAERHGGGFGKVWLEHPVGSAPKEVRTFASDGAPHFLTFSGGGRYLAVVDSGSTTVAPLGTLAPVAVPAELQAFSSDDSTAASFDAATRVVTLWSLADATQQRKVSLTSLGGRLLRVALDETGGHLAALDNNGTVTLWDTRTDREIRHWSIANSSVGEDLVISRNGKRVAVSTGGRAWILDGARAAPVGNVAADGGALAFSPDGQTLVTASNDNLQVRDATTLEPIGEALPFVLPSADPSRPPDPLWTPNVLQFTVDGRDVLVLSRHTDATVDLSAVTVDAPALAAAACRTAGRELTTDERQRFDPGHNLSALPCDT